MDLQWQQLLTHLVGFLILVWLLKRFAWGPLLAIMEERRERIVNEFKQIEEEQVKVSQLQMEFQNKLKEIDAARREKIVEAVNEGKKIAEEVKSAAHAEAREITAKAKADLERDVAKAKVQLRDEMVAITLIAAERLVREKLDDPRHRQLINSYLQEIEKA